MPVAGWSTALAADDNKDGSGRGRRLLAVTALKFDALDSRDERAVRIEGSTDGAATNR
jgi:hypothetical protein